MAALRHARGFGRVAALALCCLLAADQDAAARRTSKAAPPRPAPATLAPEFTGKPNPPGPIRLRRNAHSSRWPGARSTAGPPTITRPPSRHSWRAAAPWSAARRSRATRGRSIRRWSRSAAAPAPPCRSTLSAARRFFEENFRPLRIAKLEEPNGFLTGYYEPIVEGSRVPTDEYKVPLYRPAARPRAHGAQAQGRELPQHRPRGAPHQARQVRALFRSRRDRGRRARDAQSGDLLAQGRRTMRSVHPDPGLGARPAHGRHGCCASTTTRHNGHPYTPVGRILIERDIIPREEMSMDRIRKWMAENPDGGKELRRQNKSFVFFRVTGLPEHEEARRRAGRAAHRGALDRGRPRPACLRHAVLHRGASCRSRPRLPNTKFRRLMIAQDTGSAIVGPARADIYFGAGEEAGRSRRPDQEPGALRDADAARARSGRGRPADAAARGTPPAEGARRRGADAPQAEAPLPPSKPLAGPIPLPRPRPKS